VSEQLADLIRERQPVVVLSGAGISTESGIPDFRSPDGLWATVDPLEYATVTAFRRDPEKVWTFYAGRFAMLAGVEPNRAHRALAELERAGLVQAVVTQNIDLLHRRAGSGEVVEVHGSVAVSTCPACGTEHDLETVLEKIGEDAEHAPHCDACLAILKPGIVLFEEMLPEDAIARAYELARGAGLLLVVGTSLEVYPVAGLPSETLEAGGAVAVVNRDPTWVDPHAELVVRASAGDALAEAAARLVPSGGPASLAEPDPGWAGDADEEAARVREALGARAVEHIGSTSVPGLAAKPVLDLLAGLDSLDVEPARIRAMEALGYEALGEYGLPRRLFFRKGRDARTHHVHAVEFGGPHWRRHLAVRDYLRAHPDEAAAYEAEKRRIAAHAADRDEYTTRKAPYVEALEARALAWGPGSDADD
jgi:NAD-dependent deacetylase